MNIEKNIISYFRHSDFVRGSISKYRGLIIFNCIILFCCAIFEVFGVGLLAPVLQSLEGSEQGGFFVDLARTVFAYFSIEYSASNLLLVFGFLIFLRFSLVIYQQHWSRVLSASITCDLREKSIGNLLNRELSYFSRKKIGELVSTIFVSSQNSGGVVEYFLMMLRGFVFCMAYISVALIMSVEFTLLIGCFILFSYFFVLPRFKKGEEYGRAEKKLMDRIFDELQDRFSGIRTVKIFNRENHSFKIFKNLVGESKANDIRIMDNKLITFALFEPFLFLMIVLSIILSLRYFEIPVSNLVVSLLVFTLIIPQFKLVNGNFLTIRQLLPHLRKVNELLSTEGKLTLSDGNIKISGFEDSIKIEHIDFSYGTSTNNILNNIDMAIPKNSFLALVGPSGGGKSTLADILLRNYDPIEGRILIDNIDLRDIEIASWRKIATLVDQDCYLFTETVAGNIAFGHPNATQDQIVSAAISANAHEFIMSLPDAYQTTITNRGTNISGGERQRIALARALLVKPQILILDEATSSLDSLSERLIQKSLQSIRESTTLIIIAHRLSTIKKADNIVFIENGNIVEQGSHSDLIEIDGNYKHFIELQN